MNNEESYKQAKHDIINVLKKWDLDDLVVPEGLFAGLSVLLQAALDMAPSKHAVFGMIAGAMDQAYENSNEMLKKEDKNV